MTLTTPPSDATTTADSEGFASSNDQLLQEMRQASRDLRDILGNLNAQVADLDVLTRNILDETPQDAWDPSNSGPVFRPTGQEELKRIPRFVLTDHSTLFRQATLKVNTDLTASGISSTVAPAVVELSKSGDNDESTTNQPHQLPATQSDIGRSSSELSSSKNIRNFDCTLGEFGSSDDYIFEMGTSLVLASPVTGKGGLDRDTKAQISQLKARANNVVVFMKRGGGLTFVQKARMAQEAGASALIIGNNMANPWPYVMKDSKGESKKPGQSVSIPVAMIKEEEGREILKKFEEKKELELKKQRKRSLPPVPKQIVLENGKRPYAQNSSEVQLLSLQSTISSQTDDGCYDGYHNNSGSRSLDASLLCELHIAAQSCDCPVCCDEMKISETVVQLRGCGHIFHESCALTWLKSHNTCPYCRKELATDDDEYEEERRRRESTERSRNTIGAAGSFYG
jgi:hypothetical protein